jgi:phosphoribosyl-ATP pyrophosphohydrolase
LITDERDIEKMIKLAREGKQISKIWAEDFPDYDYWDIYMEIHEAGEKSALGTKKKITHRLNKVKTATKAERENLITEINELVDHLYIRYKESQTKLQEIRNVMEK